MPPTFLTGVIAPLFTPCYAEDRAIDYRGAAGLVDYLADTGAVRTEVSEPGLGFSLFFTP